MCHQCISEGMTVNWRGQTVPCSCPAGAKQRERVQSARASQWMLVPAGQSIVQPWQDVNGNTVLQGVGQ